MADSARPWLLVYDWACGQLMSLTVMPDDAAARLQRDEVAAAYADDASIEVSVVHGASREAVLSSRPR